MWRHHCVTRWCSDDELIGRREEGSDAAVRFGPVQRTFCLNLEPDLWFGSSRLLNLGLDLEEPVQQVRFGGFIGSNLEPQNFCINMAEKRRNII
jgi:hypothetical protein